MKAEKDRKTGKWLIQYRYTDWQGNRKKSTKRGFATKREAEEWARQFLLSQSCDFNMKFESFIELYFKDCESRLKKNTIINKRYIINLKITPVFGKKKMNEITSANVREWQNELLKQGYAQTYLKTIHNQLFTIFNHAVRLYGLKENPCHKAGSIGKAKAQEMLFYTNDEFNRFIEKVMDKRLSYICFMVLYWTGMRIGELLALNVEDVDLENKTININKSYQRLESEDVITIPKSDASNRIIAIPDFLVEDLADYLNHTFGVEPTQRLFPVSKYTLRREVKRGSETAGIKKIRIHDFRHSHAALLIDMDVPVLAISKRLGHENIETTLNTYGHLYPDKQKEIALQLNGKYQEELK